MILFIIKEKNREKFKNILIYSHKFTGTDWLRKLNKRFLRWEPLIIWLYNQKIHSGKVTKKQIIGCFELPFSFP
jgi:hypothetical protein